MDLMLHIGCEKTGTTSLQFWLAQNSEKLKPLGIFYSRALGRPNNRRISYYGLEPGVRDDGLRQEGVQTEAQHYALQEQVARDLIAEAQRARAAGCKTFVISNEHCHSRLRTEESVARVHSLLAPLFDTIKVYCLLRPQIDSCLSLASTLSRNGHLVSRHWVDREMRPSVKYYALDRLLARWAEPFGRDNIVPVAFRREMDTVAYFERELGIAEAKLPRRPAANEALDYRVISIINAILADRVEIGEEDRPNTFFVNELPIEQRLTLDRQSAQLLQMRFDASNAALCWSWPQIEFADLTPDWQNYPDEGNIDRLDMAAELGPFLRRIVDRLKGEAVYERARLMALTCEHELLMKQPEAALRACREALKLAQQAGRVAVYKPRMDVLGNQMEQRRQELEAR